jgi:hypothetical protein
MFFLCLDRLLVGRKRYFVLLINNRTSCSDERTRYNEYISSRE